MIEKFLEFARPILNFVFVEPSKSKKNPEPEYFPKLSFQSFRIQNYKGIDDVEIDLVKNNLVLLLGLNESGKTTILKAIESFSFLNDPTPEYNPSFFQKIRRKADVGSSTTAVITARIKIEQDLKIVNKKALNNTDLSNEEIELIESFLHDINQKKEVIISRVFPFKNGKPQKYYYKFETDHPFGLNRLASFFANEIVNVCPFIIYFEDFKDRIPDKIYVNEKRPESFDVIWYDIIDGLFYNTDPDFNINKFKSFYSTKTPMHDDANTVETRVNSTLNETFTKKWKNLSGVKEIEKTELKYTHIGQTQYFTLKVKDNDGTTYSVDERSKGALWYLSFLMKTEFRSKKLRRNSGKPVFLIDEPASNLHSTAQNNMIQDFKALAKDTSIIYTTHSQYLISLENIKNTYIIEKIDGVVHAHKWSTYLNRQEAQVSYYQPLANLLNIVPNTFDVPWQYCVITEGPSDRHVLMAMHRILFKKMPEYVIYPGTSATALDQLIALNIGWNSKFKVLLDCDDKGEESGERYKQIYGLRDEIVYLPFANKTIEKCFTDEECMKIRDLIFRESQGSKVKKKEFAAMWAVISESGVFDSAVNEYLTASTLVTFKEIFKLLNF